MASAVPDSSPQTPSGPAASVKPLSCPNCGGAIEVKAAGYTVTLACPYCGSLLDVADPDVKIIQLYNEMNLALEIPLGTRGTLKGVEWEAIGWLRRSEGGSYPWEEYLLFNPYHGYRWLVTDGRGWTFGTMLTETPDSALGSGLKLNGARYGGFFADGRAQVDQVLGEFYWRVQRGEEVATADYVRPGFMLSYEANQSEVSWTLGEWLEPKLIAEAFAVEPPPPWRAGGPPPLPHQPSPYNGTARSFGLFAAIAAVALIVASMIFGGSGPRQSFDMVLTPGAGSRSATFGPVAFNRASQAVTIRAQAPSLSNAWVDIDYTLVDRRSQTAYQAAAVAERYSGRDSDGDWAEGSRAATTKLATVPAGQYDLVVDASASNWGVGSMGEVPVTISIAPGGSFFSNLLLALILVVIPAIWAVMRHIGFETARQGESDAAQAAADDDDDDSDWSDE